jgi:UDP-glucuronate decarboxylase
MKTILITGGAGFLGSNLIQRLIQTENNRIICIDNLITGSRKNIEVFEKEYTNRFIFIEHDICHPLSLEDSEKIDEIYHFACIASPIKYKKYPIETLMTSILGTYNIIQICIHHQCPMLFTSTSEVYGDPLVHPQPEEYYGNVNTVGERSCYDEGKRACETLLYEYRKMTGLDFKIVRLFNTYGPKMDIHDGRVITNFIDNIIQNRPIEIYGDGSQTRSFCFVSDMIDALIRMMESEEAGPINLGNPNCEFSLNELVKLYEKIMERKLDVIYLRPTQDDPKVRKPIIDKAKSLLDWEPKVCLEDGLRETIYYFFSKHLE